MFKLLWNKNVQLSLFSAISMLSVTFIVSAAPFNAFPGNLKAKLVNVEAANVVTVSVDVWPGYPRNFRVTLPNLMLPENDPQAPACQIELIQKGLDFTNEFLTKAKNLKVKDIMMENTAETNALSNVYTNNGSLGAKLIAEGLARPASVKSTKPWC